jgi:flagellar basal body-associated protein FliL
VVKTENTEEIVTETAWYSLQKEEWGLLIGLLCGFLVVIAICIFSPARKFTTDKIVELVSSQGSKKGAAGKAFGRGLYSMGEIKMSLSQREQYIDSNIVLEYDGRMLTLSSSGEIKDQATAERFFRKEEGKMRDAIILESSSFSSHDVSGASGMDDFRDSLMKAVNGSLPVDTEPITNVFFRSFVVFNGKDDET